MSSWLPYASALSSVIPVSVYIHRLKALSNELKVLATLLIFTAIVEIIVFITAIYHANNLWIMNIYTLVEGAVYFYVIGKWFNSERLFKIAIILFLFYSLFWGYTNFITGNIIYNFNDKELTLKSIILIFLCSLLLFRLAKNEEITIIRDYRVWISFAVLFYFSISLVVFGTATLLLEGHKHVMRYSWFIHSIVNIIANLLLAYGFICYFREKKSFT